MSTKSVLFGERAAGVYRMSEIYIPSQYEEAISPEQSGKIVPAVGSLVVDDTTGLHNQQYTVTAVDPLTYEPTLIPSTFVINSASQVDRVLSYGNDIFMLYFSSVTKNVEGTNINLTRLIVDNKLSLFGKHAATYQLIQIDDDGNEKIISRKYKIAESNPNKLIPDGSVIPMEDTGVEGIRKCDGCYTDVTLTEGEEIRCDIYTAGGILIAQINLVAKKGHLLNETIETLNPIVDMTIDGTQRMPNGDLYLFRGQNVKELAIYVNLHYSDGSYKTVAIDNRRGFCYNLETVSSETVGTSFEILVKYYLSESDATGIIKEDTGSSYAIKYVTTMETPRESILGKIVIYVGETTENYIHGRFYKVVSTSASGSNTVVYSWKLLTIEESTMYYTDIPSARFISKTATIHIISGSKDLISKVSPIPIWDSTTESWSLNFLRYRDDRSATRYHATNPSDYEYVTIESGFTGNVFNVQQVVNISYQEKINNLGDLATKHESFVIELRNRSYIEDGAVYWLIKDTVDSPVTYGDDTRPHIRPKIKYVAGEGYFIPSGENDFCANSSQTATEVFIENFYTNANPPKRADESQAPTPTHFRIKKPDGTPVSQAIPVENFQQNLGIIVGASDSPSYLLNQTVVVEFLRQIDSITAEHLYGVPVDVI